MGAFITLNKDMLHMLEMTSRTFYLPIIRLPKGLQEAVGSAYLCMRSIDEIEDHADLDCSIKAQLLRAISLVFQAQTSVDSFAHHELAVIFQDHESVLPAVTLKVGEWACQAPRFIAPRIWEATAGMADRMAHWVISGWKVTSPVDLDRYTYSVAGAVGLLLCDLWAWFEKIQINRSHAIQLGRGLQTVNILRNREEDLTRGVDFFPPGWHFKDMHWYARQNLDSFKRYAETLPRTSFTRAVRIPLTLAYATLDALARGEAKLSRKAVLDIVQETDHG